jgi:hypothetical protein
MLEVQEAAMNRTKAMVVVVALVVVGSGGVMAGCSSKAALPKKAAGNLPAAAAAMGTATNLAHKPVARPAPRESATVAFTSPEYGVTFHYPRSYALREEEPEDGGSAQSTAEEDSREDLPGVRTAAELKTEQPGAILLATLVVPDDAYPNTNFAGGSVQFGVNTYETSQSCREMPKERLGDATGATGTTPVGSVAFSWAESDEGAGSTEFFERDYAGFANGACYEFFVRVGAGPSDAADQLKPANQKKILAQLEKIVTSLQVQPRAVSILDQRPAGTPKPALEWGDPKKP